MWHLCGSTGKGRVAVLDASGKPVKPAGRRLHATSHEKGAAVDLYFDGLSCRRTAENAGPYFGRETNPATVYRWVGELAKRADEILRPVKAAAGDRLGCRRADGECRGPEIPAFQRDGSRTPLCWRRLRP